MIVCPKCGNDDLNMAVQVTAALPSKYFHRITKKVLYSKDTALWGVDWSHASFVCKKCGHTIRLGEKEQK